MVRKKLIQKLQQLIDVLPIGSKRKEANYDLLILKTSNDYYHCVLLAHKYKEL